MIPDKPFSPVKPPLTPFRRNRSRVFYASEDALSSPVEQHSCSIVSSCNSNTLCINVSSSSLQDGKVFSRSMPSCVITEENEEQSNSTEEELVKSCSQELSPICSPAVSWRGSDRSSTGSWRGSPSQRSQDSGYSDSGESSSGCPTEENPSQPQVKHITRIYFGDYQRLSSVSESTQTPSAGCSYNQIVPKTNSFSTPRTFKSGKRRTSSTYRSNSNKGLCFSEPRINIRTENRTNGNKLFSPTTSVTFLDETSSQLEHKSLNSISLPVPISKSNDHKKYYNESDIKRSSKTSEIDSITRDVKEPSDSFDINNLPMTPAELNKSSSLSLKNLYTDRQKSNSFEDDSLTKLVKVSPSKQPAKRFSRVFPGKRMIKKFLSEEKLTANVIIKLRRKDPIKAKRRWSTADFERCSTPKTSVFNFGAIVERLSSPIKTNAKEDSLSVTSDTTVSPLRLAEQLRNDALHHWLGDLSRMCESECMNTLQSKSLHSEPPTPAAASTHAHLANLQKRAHVVSAEFALLCQRLENLQLSHVPSLVKSLVSYVRKFVKKYYENENSLFKSKNSLSHQVRVVQQICSRLMEICELSTSTKEKESSGNIGKENKHECSQTITEEEEEESDTFEVYCYVNGHIDKEKVRELVQIVTALGHAFTKLVDILLCQGIKALVIILEDELDEREVESAISEITALGVSGSHICKLIGRVGGIRALLEICVEPRLRKTRAVALRALATVCCVAVGIDHFEKEGGVDVVSEVLCDSRCPEEERAEAAGVLAQVTSPWVEDNHSLPFLHEHLRPLTAALTDLASSTSSPEVFLLTSAALANLTFLDTSCVDALLQSSTHKILLNEVQSKDDLSVFTKDQIATILASMSSTQAAAKEVVSAGGIRVLVSLLNTEPSDSHRLPEIAATERVQQKSAIALSRLSTDPTAANDVLVEGGAARLVHLCKNEKSRNHSDAVLVACLAALRKIASSCGSEELRQVDASELIEPRLLDSFLIYSSQQESFV